MGNGTVMLDILSLIFVGLMIVGIAVARRVRSRSMLAEFVTLAVVVLASCAVPL